MAGEAGDTGAPGLLIEGKGDAVVAGREDRLLEKTFSD